MRTGLITICDDFLIGRADFVKNTQFLTKKLTERGLAVAFNLVVSSNAELTQAIDYVKNTVNTCFVTGDIEPFAVYCNQLLGVEGQKIIVIDGAEFILMPEYNKDELEFVLPLLGLKGKSLYETAIFKTFGLTEGEIRELIKDYLKNKNRIMINLYPSVMECDIHVRYSFKMSKMAVDEVLFGINQRLEGHIYAADYSSDAKKLMETTLSSRANELLRLRNKSIAIAESFTGGLLTAEFVKTEGASNYLFEGLVAYSNEAKVKRLMVEPQIINSFGAVSIETAYEMAANLLSLYPTDLVVATTGFAGPNDAENQTGKCFIAVGDSDAIHVYPYILGGTREEIMQGGVKCALYNIIKKLKQNQQYN